MDIHNNDAIIQPDVFIILPSTGARSVNLFIVQYNGLREE